jgi:putative spermidine/putrescine transport system ATP-binding protein
MNSEPISSSTRITVERCARTYADGTRGLRPTDLQVNPGEVLALLGPSGCGKTTLLRLLAGLEPADAGSRILFDTQEVTHRPAERRDVGMVFQSYALFPQMTVAANIGYGLRVRGVAPGEIRRRVGELIDLVRLQGLELRRPGELSGGQRQRVALARAVAVRPRVLLLDEPLAALDAQLKESLRDELAELLRRLGITAVHVTHDQHEAFAIADRLAVMFRGAIVQVGDGETLYRQPAHPFVAEFLGRVNRLRADAAGDVVLGGHLLARGAPHGLLVRPEDLELGAPVAGAALAQVLHRSFLGDRLRLRVQAEGQAPLLADVARDSPWCAGQAVALRIDPARLMPAAASLPAEAQIETEVA